MPNQIPMPGEAIAAVPDPVHIPDLDIEAIGAVIRLEINAIRIKDEQLRAHRAAVIEQIQQRHFPEAFPPHNEMGVYRQMDNVFAYLPNKPHIGEIAPIEQIEQNDPKALRCFKVKPKKKTKFRDPQEQGDRSMHFNVGLSTSRLSWRPTYRQINDTFTALLAADAAMAHLDSVIKQTRAPIKVARRGSFGALIKELEKAMTRRDYAARLDSIVTELSTLGGMNCADLLAAR